MAELELWRCPDCDHCFSDIGSIRMPENYSPYYYEVNHRNWFEHPNIKLFEKISRFIASDRSGSSLIDIGCGNGNFLKYLRAINPKLSLTGVDITPNEPFEGITFLQGDALLMEFDRQYDIVVTLAVIEHLHNVRKFVHRLHTLCSTSGFVIIMTLNDQSVLYGVARLLYALGYRSPCMRLYEKHHLNHFNLSSLRRLVETSGLRVVKTVLHNVPLAAAGVTASSSFTKALQLAGVWGTFILGSLTGRTYLQTIICEKTAGKDF